VPKPNAGGTSDNIWELIGAAQSAIVTILATATTVVVPNTLVTAGAVILVQLRQAAEDATAERFWVSAINPGVSFTISTNAAATANTNVEYFVVKYSA
jgi:hypothetical protein